MQSGISPIAERTTLKSYINGCTHTHSSLSYLAHYDGLVYFEGNLDLFHSLVYWY